MFLTLFWQKYNLNITDNENTYLNANISEKVCTKLGKGFGHLRGKRVRIIRSIYVLISSGRSFQLHLRSTLRDIGFTSTLYQKTSGS